MCETVCESDPGLSEPSQPPLTQNRARPGTDTAARVTDRARSRFDFTPGQVRHSGLAANRTHSAVLPTEKRPLFTPLSLRFASPSTLVSTIFCQRTTAMAADLQKSQAGDLTHASHQKKGGKKERRKRRQATQHVQHVTALDMHQMRQQTGSRTLEKKKKKKKGVYPHFY